LQGLLQKVPEKVQQRIFHALFAIDRDKTISAQLDFFTHAVPHSILSG
jgi:hypothetical protein